MDKEKQIEFEKRIKCGVAYCEDKPNNQIEEMAKDIETIEKEEGHKLLNETLSYVNKHHKYNSKEDYSLAHIKTLYVLTAEKLYKQGYRNCKDMVVLSREEYEELKGLKPIEINSFDETLTNRIRLLEIENNGLREYHNSYLDKLKQERKETAEKFYKKVRKLLKKVDIIVDGDEGLVGYEESAVDKGLTEIAKQFGGEIKE